MIRRLYWNARKEVHHEPRRMTIDWAHSKNISRLASDCEYDGHSHHEYDVDHSQPPAAHSVKLSKPRKPAGHRDCLCLSACLILFLSFSLYPPLSLSHFSSECTQHTWNATTHQAHYTIFPAHDVGENKDCPFQSGADDKNLLQLLWVFPDLWTHAHKKSMLSSCSVGQAEWSCNSPAQGIWVSGKNLPSIGLESPIPNGLHARVHPATRAVLPRLLPLTSLHALAFLRSPIYCCPRS